MGISSPAMTSLRFSHPRVLSNAIKAIQSSIRCSECSLHFPSLHLSPLLLSNMLNENRVKMLCPLRACDGCTTVLESFRNLPGLFRPLDYHTTVLGILLFQRLFVAEVSPKAI